MDARIDQCLLEILMLQQHLNGLRLHVDSEHIRCGMQYVALLLHLLGVGLAANLPETEVEMTMRAMVSWQLKDVRDLHIGDSGRHRYMPLVQRLISNMLLQFFAQFECRHCQIKWSNILVVRLLQIVN